MGVTNRTSFTPILVTDSILKEALESNNAQAHTIENTLDRGSARLKTDLNQDGIWEAVYLYPNQDGSRSLLIGRITPTGRDDYPDRIGTRIASNDANPYTRLATADLFKVEMVNGHLSIVPGQDGALDIVAASDPNPNGARSYVGLAVSPAPPPDNRSDRRIAPLSFNSNTDLPQAIVAGNTLQDPAISAVQQTWQQLSDQTWAYFANLAESDRFNKYTAQELKAGRRTLCFYDPTEVLPEADPVIRLIRTTSRGTERPTFDSLTLEIVRHDKAGGIQENKLTINFVIDDQGAVFTERRSSTVDQGNKQMKFQNDLVLSRKLIKSSSGAAFMQWAISSGGFSPDAWISYLDRFSIGSDPRDPALLAGWDHWRVAISTLIRDEAISFLEKLPIQ